MEKYDMEMLNEAKVCLGPYNLKFMVHYTCIACCYGQNLDVHCKLSATHSMFHICIYDTQRGDENLNLITKTNKEVLSKAKVPVTTSILVSSFTILLLISQ